MATLSIVIPTYNRPKDILARVGELFPQLSEGVELVIIDNCSSISVKNLIYEAYPQSADRIQYIRNPVNVGGNANICRCFEVGSGEWTWLLGDDDEVDPHAVAMILEEIKEQGEAIHNLAGFNFSTGIFQYPEASDFDNLDDYCRFSLCAAHFGNALFMSSCVYQAAIVRPHLSQAYQSMGSCAPQMVVVLRSILTGSRWRTSTRKLVDWKPAEQGQQWNTFYLAAGLPILIDVPGCSREVMNYIHGGLGTTLWRPLLNGGIQMCLFNEEYSRKYWVILFTRLRRLLKGINRVKLEVLYWFAVACYRVPGFKCLCGVIFRLLQLSKPFDFDMGRNRL